MTDAHSLFNLIYTSGKIDNNYLCDLLFNILEYTNMPHYNKDTMHYIIDDTIEDLNDVIDGENDENDEQNN